ncbi:uncharacterized protein A1O9_12073 [Exophiala aquamarina CBS 119918]|uniref:1-alkyl-2-acetylglycerophosphocholine esterase n=1 Tax=Exophiala aquamarina CBS 119918 TaxID=1182545 RepID=A0A072NVW9_9EURO|nr:uncharacterized protein A1O9_12073 [Exophiala aquamarina CBS 119918]KEF51736.1 hypothetical protein A1O9_12073 [Exophiala aquamarina CBS 119918]
MIGMALFFMSSLLARAMCHSTVLPPPPGPTNVHMTHFPVVDAHRADPLAPCCNQPRRLMLTLFQPAECSQTEDFLYMPPATAAVADAYFRGLGVFPNDSETFSHLHLRACPQSPENVDFPLLLFSHGYGLSRFDWSNLLQWIASAGFNVVSIDHTYDANIVEFPDGSVIKGLNLTTLDQVLPMVQLLLQNRVADISTVLDFLSNATNTEGLGIPTLQTARIGVFGHSLGGATAADTALVDSRMVAGLALDGGIFANATQHPVQLPFVLIQREGHNQSADAALGELSSNVTQLWTQLKGSKLQLEIFGTVHDSFSDLPIVADSIGLDVNTLPYAKYFVGTIDGLRLLNIERSYIKGFFEETLEAKQVDLLHGPSSEFPEVHYVNISTAAQANA